LHVPDSVVKFKENAKMYSHNVVTGSVSTYNVLTEISSSFRF